MTDDQKNQPTNDAHPGDITRRDFAALLVGTGLDVEIKTPDGTCDGAFIRPKTDSHPGVFATVQSAATVGLEVRPKSWSVSKRATLQHRSANDSQAFTASTVPYRRRRALLARSKPPHCNSKLRILREKQTCLIFYSPNSRFSFACGSCRFRIGFHGNFNFGTFLHAHFITIFIRE